MGLYEMRPVDSPLRDGLISFYKEVSTHLKSGSMVVEVGSYSGESMEIALKTLTVPVVFWAVDNWKGGYADWDHHTRESVMPKVRSEFFKKVNTVTPLETGTIINVLEMTGEEATKRFKDNSISLIYIDADHSYESVLVDIQMWKSKVKKGGIIAGHDYEPNYPGVMKAVDEVLGKPDKVFADSSWMVVKA